MDHPKMIAFHLHTFLVRHNGGVKGRTMPIFCAFELILQIILVILTGVRAGFDGYGWSWVVCGINIFNVLFYYYDFFNYGFNSPLSLFFLLILESISLAANILVRAFCSFLCFYRLYDTLAFSYLFWIKDMFSRCLDYESNIHVCIGPLVPPKGSIHGLSN